MAIQMTRKEYEAKYGASPVTSSAPIKMTRAEYEAKYGKPESTTINRLNNVPILGQVSNFGIGVGSAIGSTIAGIPEALSRGIGLGASAFGLKNENNEFYKNADKIKDFRNKIFKEPFQKSLETKSGIGGQVVGNIAPYFAGAGVVNPLTQGMKIFPKVLARTLPDIAISAAQSGGNPKAIGATGVTSAVANTLFPGGGKVVSTVKDLLKSTGKSTAVGYVGDVSTGMAGLRGEDREGAKAFIPGLGSAIGFGLGATSGGIQYLSKQGKNAKLETLKTEIKQEVDTLLNKTKGVINKTQLGNKKNTNYNDVISDPVIFRGLKVLDKKIDPNEAINTINQRIDDVMDAKSKMLPEVDKYAPRVTRAQLKQGAYSNVEGKYLKAEEIAIKKAIDKQIDALPESFLVSEVDNIRARARASSKNAQGLPLNNEYTAIENSARDIVFKSTDNLPIPTNGEFARANNYVKDMLNTREFLDKTLRGQVVAGGKLSSLTGRVVGGVLGSTGGFWTGLIGQEAGAKIANILTNNQLGSSVKMRMIQDITDNPEVLKDVNTILERMSQYNPYKTPAITSGAIRTPDPRQYNPDGSIRTSKVEIIPAQKNLTTNNPQTGRFQTTYSSSNQSLPQEKITPIATTTKTVNKNGIPSSIAQTKPNVNTLPRKTDPSTILPDVQNNVTNITGEGLKTPGSGIYGDVKALQQSPQFPSVLKHVKTDAIQGLKDAGVPIPPELSKMTVTMKNVKSIPGIVEKALKTPPPLFHGATTANAESIIKNGFNPKHTGVSGVKIWGDAVNLTDSKTANIWGSMGNIFGKASPTTILKATVKPGLKFYDLPGGISTLPKDIFKATGGGGNEVIKYLKKLGYDGVRTNIPDEGWIIFDPKNVTFSK